MTTRKYSYGQHFLRNPDFVAELIGHSTIHKNDTVYDLGAGSGIISAVLAPRCKQVIAVENEKDALQKLYVNMAGYRNVTILPASIVELPAPQGEYKIFANIPFNLSSQVVEKFCTMENPPKAMYLIVQKQFARKLVPGNDHFTSAMSAQISPWFDVRIRKPLRRTDFTPPPAVDTVLLELKLRENPLLPRNQAERYRQFIVQCFSRQVYFAKVPRENAGISPELRPSQLTTRQWLDLYAATS
ncbi:hypothetical protein KBD87_03505 [Candidatus Saccharibacteria bacterium]|nr:hypothetical protein [Candidatus Saccharibacteria bacterium]